MNQQDLVNSLFNIDVTYISKYPKCDIKHYKYHPEKSMLEIIFAKSAKANISEQHTTNNLERNFSDRMLFVVVVAYNYREKKTTTKTCCLFIDV